MPELAELRLQWEALATEPLTGLPPEALRASIHDLAGELLTRTAPAPPPSGRGTWLRPSITIVPMWSWLWWRKALSDLVTYALIVGTFALIRPGHGWAAAVLAALAVFVATSFLRGFIMQLWRQRADLAGLWRLWKTGP